MKNFEPPSLEPGNIPEALSRLSRELPPVTDGQTGDADHQARAALAYLVERASEFSPEKAVAENPETCPNCGAAMAGRTSPYCGQECRDEAAFVRQFRRSLVEGSAFDKERQASLGQVFWHLIGGGYPRRQTLVTDKERKRIFARYEGRCQVCGAEATTFDHIGSACNRTSNLRSVCGACTTTQPFGNPGFLTRAAVQSHIARLASRIGSPVALRCCDNPDTWDWRAYVKARLESRQSPQR